MLLKSLIRNVYPFMNGQNMHRPQYHASILSCPVRRVVKV